MCISLYISGLGALPIPYSLESKEMCIRNFVNNAVAVDVDVDDDGDSWSSSTPKQFVGLGSQLKNKRLVEEYLVSKRVMTDNK